MAKSLRLKRVNVDMYIHLERMNALQLGDTDGVFVFHRRSGKSTGGLIWPLTRLQPVREVFVDQDSVAMANPEEQNHVGE
ncbi:MAG: hypothetical protein JXR76_23685 [Deltaproteobacteria bacterium]|nr:hypothetical protein [Deltaproteobacteria bacterium]